jgi:hypothetical protein
MRGKDCFLKDLKEGDLFEVKKSGGIRYTVFKTGEFVYTVKDPEGKKLPYPIMTPVRPIKEI